MNLSLSYFGHIMSRDVYLEKTIRLGKPEGNRKRGRPHMGRIDFLTETTGLNLQELNKAVEVRIFWRSLIHRGSISWS